VGTALSGALQFLFQGFLAGVKLVLGGLAQLAGSLLSGLGNFIGSSLVSALGGSLRSLGGSLISSARSFFQTGIKDLFSQIKTQGFSAVKDWLKGTTPTELRPRINYGAQFPDGVLPTRTPSGGFVFLDHIKDTTKIPIQVGTQKSTFDLLLKVVLDTATNAAIGAVQGQVNQFFSSNQTQIQGTRAPPINAPTLQASNDSNSKSISIKDPNRTQNPFSVQRTPFGENLAFAYDSNGTPIRYQSSRDGIPRGLENINNNRFRVDRDEGNFTYLKYDPNSQNPFSTNQVGNFNSDPGGDPKGPAPNRDERWKKPQDDKTKVKDFIEKLKILGIERGADDPFKEVKIFDRWEDVPDYIRNYKPGDSFGNYVADRGNHVLGQMKRLPGGYHIGVDKLGGQVYAHFDAFDPLKGFFPETVAHGVFEVARIPTTTVSSGPVGFESGQVRRLILEWWQRRRGI